MRIVIRKRAVDDLDGVFAWIAQDNPGAAAAIVARIKERIELLANPGLAHMGRPGLVPGTRELVEPHVIVYEVQGDRHEIVVLAIFHGAQSR